MVYLKFYQNFATNNILSSLGNVSTFNLDSLKRFFIDMKRKHRLYFLGLNILVGPSAVRFCA
jgi:hypothetical protein